MAKRETRSLRATEDEWNAVERAAGVVGISASTLARRAAVSAARRITDVAAASDPEIAGRSGPGGIEGQVVGGQNT